MDQNIKKKVVVMMGGSSSEHDVSIASGEMVIKNIPQQKYEVRSLVLNYKGQDLWKFEDSLLAPFEALKKIKQWTDVVFIALHGMFGEDGTVQALFDFMDIKYTGSGVLASALAMDKAKSNELFLYHGMNVPKYINFSDSDWEENSKLVTDNIKKEIGLPFVVKPVNNGSSHGVMIVDDQENFQKAIGNALKYGSEIMIQKYIKGVEVTCGVLYDGKDETALVPTEIVPPSESFFDYKAKYTPGGSEEITPARLSEDLLKEIQSISTKTHRLIGCKGFSRTDMIISDGNIYVLEINTIPGLTKTSLLPQGAEAAGISFSDLLNRIIKEAMSRN